jgi:hypothetical protein
LKRLHQKYVIPIETDGGSGSARPTHVSAGVKAVRKHDRIEAATAGYERKIKEAQADLSPVTASLRIFGLSGDPSEFPGYWTKGLGKNGEEVTP